MQLGRHLGNLQQTPLVTDVNHVVAAATYLDPVTMFLDLFFTLEKTSLVATIATLSHTLIRTIVGSDRMCLEARMLEENRAQKSRRLGFQGINGVRIHCCVHLVLPPILQACYGCPESSISKLEIEREIPKQLFCTFTTHSLTHLALPKMTGGEGLINLVPVIDDCYTPQIIYGTVKSLLQGIGCV